MKPIIVGYDPGTTAAMAVIDVKGNVLLLKSKRGMTKEDIVDYVTQIGKPMIIAGDKSPPSKGVEKLASALGCNAYKPPQTLSNLEKWKLVNDFTEKIKNDHEKDALASAFKAHEQHSNLFKRIDSVLSSLSLSDLYDEVLSLVVLGKADNVTDAINRVLSKMREKKPKEKPKKRRTKRTPKIVTELREEIKGKENDIEILKRYNKGLKEKLKKAQETIRRYKKMSEDAITLGSLGKMKKTAERLKERVKERDSVIEKWKSLRRLESKGYVPILSLNELSLNSIENLQRTFDLKDRVISVDDLSNVQMLNDFQIKALVTISKPNKKVLEKVNFPIVKKTDLLMEKVEDILVVQKEEFEGKLKKARKRGLIGWLKGYKKRKS